MPDDVILARAWSELSRGPIDEASVRALYANRGAHRIGVSRYPVGARFRGAAKAGDCYVLRGVCRYSFAACSVELHAEQFAALPAGEYGFEVVGPVPVVLVRAWQLPDSVPV